MNGYTFRGINSVIFIVVSHIHWGHLIKERICSHPSKFFPLRVDPILKDCPPGKQTGHAICLPLKTWRKNKSAAGIAWCPATALTSSKVTVLHLCMSSVMLYICTKFCEIIWNDITVIEWTWFLYWKLQRGIILQKRYNFHTNHIQTYEVALNRKKCRRTNSSQSKYGHTCICTMLREIISNRIKVIQPTQFLY